VYATCSSEPDENDAVVDAFLASTPGFRLLDAADASPELPKAVIDGRGCLRTEPHRHGLEGFFGAVLGRTPRGHL
jgi:16S rRNA (cytosine967-C5)-methyltransferase